MKVRVLPGVLIAKTLPPAISAIKLARAGGRGSDDGPLSRDDYRQELVAAFAGVALDADRADVGGLRELAGQLRAVVDDLKDLVPPPDAAAAHARLVGGMYDYARTLDAFITHRGGVVGYHQFLMEVGGTRALDWLQAYNALAAQGYVTAVLLRP